MFKNLLRWMWDWTKSIVIALVVFFFLRAFLVEAFRIPSGSMERTLLVGDFLFVNKLLYGAEVPILKTRLPALREPVLGDILVFDSIEDEEIKVVKRLVGVAGDTLSMKNGVLYRNGFRVDEPWVIREPGHPGPADDLIDPGTQAKMRRWQLPHYVGVNPAKYAPNLNNWGPVVVPHDSLFMMGDNRDGSYDGRYWGFLPRKNVRGRPILVYYSYDPETFQKWPAVTSVRWRRLFTVPK